MDHSLHNDGSSSNPLDGFWKHGFTDFSFEDYPSSYMTDPPNYGASADMNYLHQADVDHNLEAEHHHSSGYHQPSVNVDEAHGVWNAQAQSHHFSREDVYPQDHLTEASQEHQALHGPDAIFLPYEEPPSKADLNRRYYLYNKHVWQRSLKLEQLEDIYTKVGSRWDESMPASTFRDTFKHLNELLERQPSFVLPILQGNEAAIEDVARQGRPSKRKSEAKPSRIMTMDSYLALNRKRMGLSYRPQLETNSLEDEKKIRHPQWAPLEMGKEARDKIKARLRMFWGVKDSTLRTRLSKFGRSTVAKHADKLLSNDLKEAQEAATELSKSKQYDWSNNHLYQTEYRQPVVSPNQVRPSTSLLGQWMQSKHSH